MVKKVLGVLWLMGLVAVQKSFAEVITVIKDGNWSNTEIWDSGKLPTSTDDVVLNGFQVTVNNLTTTVNSITLGSKVPTQATSLTLSGTTQLTTNEFSATIGASYPNVVLSLEASAILIVNGDCLFQRIGVDNTDHVLQLAIKGKAGLKTKGNFIFDYQGASSGELDIDLHLRDSASLEVGANLQLKIQSGVGLTFLLEEQAQLSVTDSLQLLKLGGAGLLLQADSLVIIKVGQSCQLNTTGGSGDNLLVLNQVGGFGMLVQEDLLLSNTVQTASTEVQLNKKANLEVDKDVILKARSEGDVALRLNEETTLQLGGQFDRTNTYGALWMATKATLIYDGDSDQIIACDNIPGSGTDRFVCTNIAFANTSGRSIALEGDWTIEGELTLSIGVIASSDTAMLIIADGASIGGGSQEAYIDGPILKRGTTNEQPFLFPIGDQGVYAPLQISAIRNTSYEYQAQYFSCPPPIEDGIEPPLTRINGHGFWTLRKNSGAEDPNVSLFWEDAGEGGIDDLDSLHVAGLTDQGGTTSWLSYGNGGTTGGTGKGSSGSVTNDAAYPPPLDEIDKLTLGATGTTTNALPVIFVDFGAKIKEQSVQLDWTTIMEENTDRFEVEHSRDGQYFQAVGELMARGFNAQSHSYTFTHHPQNLGIQYYRLRQVDHNEQWMYSPILSVELTDQNGSLSFFPNPVRQSIQIEGLQTRQNDVNVEVFDQYGKLVFSGSVAVTNGALSFDVTTLGPEAKGNFYLLVHDLYGIRTIQFVRL